MAYKKIERDVSFADIAVQKFADKNRSMLFLRQVNNTIDWQPVQGWIFPKIVDTPNSQVV